MAEVAITEPETVAKRQHPPTDIDASGGPTGDDVARIELQADPSWLKRIDVARRSVGLNRAQFFRWAANRLIAFLEESHPPHP